jgi:hypothetical protein
VRSKKKDTMWIPKPPKRTHPSTYSGSRRIGNLTHSGDTAKSIDMIRGLADQYEMNTEFHVTFGTADATGSAANALQLHVRNVEASSL